MGLKLWNAKTGIELIDFFLMNPSNGIETHYISSITVNKAKLFFNES
jgi:hypothetical protein